MQLSRRPRDLSNRAGVSVVLLKHWAFGLAALLSAVLPGCGDTATPVTPVADVQADLANPYVDIALGGDADSSSIPETSGPTCIPGDTGPGCPCKSNADCDNQFCIDTPDGRQCARPCVATCPDGFLCNTVTSPGNDTISICIPQFGRRCDPCSASKDCDSIGISGSVCVPFGGQGQAGAFCGSPCAENADCGTAFDCISITSVEGQKTNQCVPKGNATQVMGECTCSKSAQSKGLQTSCLAVVTDDTGKTIGQCPGVRQCGADGLTQCAAPGAKAEVCDGLDNDCNGQTDEGTCDDKNVCTTDICNPALAGPGKEGCSHPIATGPCDADGNNCTVADACDNGVCKPGQLKDCSDGNPCTKDVCDVALGCTNTNDDGAGCNDTNPCTVNDQCKSGSCISGPQKDCDVGKPCIVSSCDLKSGNCLFQNKPDATPCDDGLACTELDTCAGAECLGKVKNCDDGNACTLEACDAAVGCKYVKLTSSCDDNSACTVNDVCNDGFCLGTSVNCDDGNQCTDDKCDAKLGCVNTANVGPCSDGDACTTGDACKDKFCNAGIAKVCDDKSVCTTDSCNIATGICVFDAKSNENMPCDADGSVCSVGDKCQSGLCTAGKLKVCDDANPCTDDSCDPVKDCLYLNSLKPCNADDNPCTVGDACSGGVCKAGTAKVCDDQNPCTSDSCDPNPPNSGACVYSAAALAGAPCDADKSVCTKNDACLAGKCTVGAPLNCDDGNSCTDDSCDPLKGCQNVNNVAPCSDNVPCTVGDACKDAVCKAGAPKVCDDTNPCTFDSCTALTGACSYDPKAMEAAGCDADGSVCTQNDKCIGGKCTVGALVNCDDGNQCTVDTCDAKLSCQHVNATIVCSDGNACTVGDLCKAGACNGTPANCDDANSCTTDSCDKAQGCLHVGIADGTLCAAGMVCASALCKPAICGDNIIQSAVEKCDGTALAGQTCGTILGAGSDGTLACSNDCKGFDTTGCTVDLSWMDQSDDCGGFRQAQKYPTVHFAVSKSNTWDKAKNYQCPKGNHWASTAEGNALFLGSGGGTALVYYSQCGWNGFTWPLVNGITREFFRFSDSAVTYATKNAADQEQTIPGVQNGTALFGGIVCVKD